MEKIGFEAQQSFTQPVRQIVLMLVVTALVIVGAWFAWPMVRGVFSANPMLNGFIGFVFVLGVLTCFWQVLQLFQSVIWIEDFVQEPPRSGFRRRAAVAGPTGGLVAVTRGADADFFLQRAIHSGFSRHPD